MEVLANDTDEAAYQGAMMAFLSNYGLDAAAILGLARRSEPVRYDPGEAILHQGKIEGFVYFLIKGFGLYVVTQWVKGTFPRIRVDQMTAFAWKILVPLVLGLILWQMLAMKLPIGALWQYVLVLAGNLIVVGVVLNVLGRYFQQEQVRTKRAFEPKSLIGTMQPAGD
jgi:hypothetical protein